MASKKVLSDDKKTFEVSTDGRVKIYRWNGQEENE